VNLPTATLGRAWYAISACYPRAYTTVNVFESSRVVDVIECVSYCRRVGEDMSFGKGLAFDRQDLCVAYLWQRNRKWLVVSVMFGQCGQCGDSTFLIRKRCPLSGM